MLVLYNLHIRTSSRRRHIEQREYVYDKSKFLVRQDGVQHHVHEGWRHQRGQPAVQVHARRDQHQAGPEAARQCRIKVPEERRRLGCC